MNYEGTTVHIQLFNMMGHELIRPIDMSIDDKVQYIELVTSPPPVGIYIAKITEGEKEHNSKLEKQ